MGLLNRADRLVFKSTSPAQLPAPAGPGLYGLAERPRQRTTFSLYVTHLLLGISFVIVLFVGRFQNHSQEQNRDDCEDLWENHVEVQQADLYQQYHTRLTDIADKVCMFTSHPLSEEFQPLPPGQRCRYPTITTKRAKSSIQCGNEYWGKYGLLYGVCTVLRSEEHTSELQSR